MRYGEWSVYTDLDAIEAAERVLQNDGLNMERAFNFLLSWITNNRKMPGFETVASSSDKPLDEELHDARAKPANDATPAEAVSGYKKIGTDERECAWELYIKQYRSLGCREPQLEGIVDNLIREKKMNPASARIYISTINALVTGKGTSNQIKRSDLEEYIMKLAKASDIDNSRIEAFIRKSTWDDRLSNSKSGRYRNAIEQFCDDNFEWFDISA